MKELQEIKTWLSQKTNSANAETRKGYLALFYGESPAKLNLISRLAKDAGKELYRVDLSKITGKYIGETEKNLSTIFETAEKKDVILFFDEADALFGKRTGIKDSHDRYANQEVSYLMQRIEAYRGLVILATNKKESIDNAFLRRFQTTVHIPAE